MAEIDDAGPEWDRPGRAALIGSLLFVLVLLVSVAAGIGAGLVLLAAVLVLSVAMTAIRGRSPSLRVGNLRAALGVTAAGCVALALGGAVPPPTQNTAALGAAPSTGAAPTTGPALPPAPVMAMTCPAGNAGASPQFDRRVSAAVPYSVTIDYGDGDSYTNDDQHLGAIFSHTYPAPGAFTVTAVLTDANGQTASASCIYRWTGRR